MTFSQLFPGIAPAVSNLTNVWPGSVVAESVWLYAVFGALHLVFLALLGGAVILLNTRVLGVGLTSQTPEHLERTLRPYLWIGVVGILFTGIIIGWANADKLYNSAAFFIKMVSLAGALIFSFGVSTVAARSEGDLPMPTKIAAVIAFLLFLWANWIFISTGGTNPGSIHILTAGYGVLLAFARPLTRMAAGGILGVLGLVYLIGGYFVIGGPNGVDANGNTTFEPFMGLTKGCAIVAAIALVAMLAYEIFAGKKDDESSDSVRKLIALFAILTWVTAAAAGRWIGLSP